MKHLLSEQVVKQLLATYINVLLKHETGMLIEEQEKS